MATLGPSFLGGAAFAQAGDDRLERLEHLAARRDGGDRLAAVGGVRRRLGIGRHGEVELAAEGALELLPRHTAVVARDVVGDEDEAGEGRQHLDLALQADGVAQPGEAEIGDGDHLRRVGEDAGAGRGIAARHVDHDAVRLAGELVEEQIHRRGVVMEVGLRRLLGGHDHELLPDLHGGAADEQAVDPARMLERLAQPVGGLHVEGEGDGAVLEIEVEQRRPALELVGDEPGAVDRERAGPDAAAGADQRHHRPALGDARLGGLGRALVQPAEGQVQRLLRHGLHQVLGHARFDHLAIERDVVGGADGDQLRLLGEGRDDRQQGGERAVRIAHVDDEKLRSPALGQVFERLAAAAVPHPEIGEAQAADRGDRAMRLVVGDEGHAVRRGGGLRRSRAAGQAILGRELGKCRHHRVDSRNGTWLAGSDVGQTSPVR